MLNVLMSILGSPNLHHFSLKFTRSILKCVVEFMMKNSISIAHNLVQRGMTICEIMTLEFWTCPSFANASRMFSFEPQIPCLPHIWKFCFLNEHSQSKHITVHIESSISCGNLISTFSNSQEFTLWSSTSLSLYLVASLVM